MRAPAAEYPACWTTTVYDPVRLKELPKTTCLTAGGTTIDYTSDADVPAVLSPNLGTDLSGPCWYLTSAATPYIVITRYGDGSADIAYLNPDAADEYIVVGPNLRRCTSQPTPDADPAAEAWSYAMSYVHDPPTPDLNPQPGQGVTGLATYIGVPIPDDHEASLTSGVSSLDLEITVDAVIVTWGDGEATTYPADPEILAGYPEGQAQHTYEVKTADGNPLTVEYDWTAHWRIDGGTWIPLDVPNTTTTIDYPIAEVVSRLGDQ